MKEALDYDRLNDLDFASCSEDELQKAFEFMADWLSFQLPGNRFLLWRVFDEAKVAGVSEDAVMLILHEFELTAQITTPYLRPHMRKIEVPIDREYLAVLCKGCLEWREDALRGREKVRVRKSLNENVVPFEKA